MIDFFAENGDSSQISRCLNDTPPNGNFDLTEELILHQHFDTFGRKIPTGQ
jgi:hypothetical protein